MLKGLKDMVCPICEAELKDHEVHTNFSGVILYMFCGNEECGFGCEAEIPADMFLYDSDVWEEEN